MKTILCVEPNPLNLEILDEYLHDTYLVDSVSNGKGCLRYLEDDIPDLILLNLELIDSYRINICKAIKENPSAVKIPIVITSDIELEDKGDGIKCDHAKAHLVKPFSEKALLGIISVLCNSESLR